MKKYTMETAVGIFLVFGLLCVGYMTVKLGHVSLFGDDSYSLLPDSTRSRDSGPAALSISPALT